MTSFFESSKIYIVDFLKIFFTFVILLDPIGITPSFISVAGDFERKVQLKILKQANIFAAILLYIFALGGKYILSFFGIHPGSFYIAGGFIFFTIALDMIRSKPRYRNTPRTLTDPSETSMIAVFPLAFPLIAGPGMITNIMLFTANSEANYPNGWIIFVIVILAITAALLVEYVILRSSSLLVKVIGTTGMFVMEKVLGLILAGLSVQIVYEGLVLLKILS